MTRLESKIVCIYQVMGSKIKLLESMRSDYGCAICAYNDKNKECPDYKPMKLYYFNVKK